MRSKPLKRAADYELIAKAPKIGLFKVERLEIESWDAAMSGVNPWRLQAWLRHKRIDERAKPRQILRSCSRTATWQRMQRLANHWIPAARILHPYPWDRFDDRTPGSSRVR